MNKRSTALAALLGATFVFASGHSRAEEDEDPAIPRPTVQFDFGLRGVTSLNAVKQYDRTSGIGVVDFSDTLVYARGRAPLIVSGGRGRVGSLMALTFPDTYYEPGTIFLAEANAFYEDRYFRVRIGRARIGSRVVPMPTLRDDDLIRFSDAQNPFSDGRSSADHQFGNIAHVNVFPTPRIYGEVHLENLPTFVLRPETIGAFVLNSYGGSFGYREIAGLARTAVVRQLGVNLNTYRLGLPTQEIAFDVTGGGWVNLVPDPIHGVDFRVQGIFNRGIPGLPIMTITDTFRTQQVSAVASLGYDYRRQMLPTFRTNVIGGYKRYLEPGVDQVSVVYNAFYSLGVAADIGIQYQMRTRARIPEAFGDDFAHSIKIAFVVALEATTNPVFEERDSLLNTESGYLP